MPACTNAAEKPSRSRNGCSECRRLHKKCDEKHPQCDNCVQADKNCSYQKRLSWGGRPFKKSPFKNALANGVVAIRSQEVSDKNPRYSSPFVYSTTRCSPVEEVGSLTSSFVLSEDEPIVNSSRLSFAPSDIYTNPEWASWLPSEHRALVHHFIHDLTPSFSLHKSHHDEFCSTLIPMALSRESGNYLLNSIVGSASIHRASQSSDRLEIPYNQMHHVCIQYLSRHKVGEDQDLDEAYVATALVQCLSEILTGGEKMGSWRLHLEGATAALRTFGSDVDDLQRTSPTRTVLRRWCQSLQAIALSSDPVGDMYSFPAHESLAQELPHEDYIDMYHGFSSRLLPHFCEIHALGRQAQALKHLEYGNLYATKSSDILRCMIFDRANHIVRAIMNSVASPTHQLDPSIKFDYRADWFSDFQALDSAYHQTALLEVYQRVYDRPPTDQDVQAAVENGIERLKDLALREGSCPRVATLHPAFTIGCSAVMVEQRLFTMDWLEKLRNLYGMGNVQSAKRFLLELWQRNDSLKSAGGHIQWCELMQEKEWDLSLY